MFFNLYTASPGVPKNSVGRLDVWPQEVINHLCSQKGLYECNDFDTCECFESTPLTFAHEGFGCNFWVIAFVWGAGGLLFLLNFPYHIETPIMWCKKFFLLDCSEGLAWLARVINHRRQKQLLPVACVLVVRKTRMVGKAVGPDFEECPAREFFLKDPRAWPSVSKRLSWERRMRKSFALWIFWLANISYSTATCGIRNENGVGIRVAGGLSTHFGEWPHVCSILRFQII